MRSLVLLLSCAVAITLHAQKGADLPAVNKDVIAFVQAHMGRKVGHGECWDLAAEALNTAQAHWDGFYGFGEEVKPEDVLPGDIIQFEGVLIEARTETSLRQESYGHHTAIVMAVRAPGVFTMAHQNAGTGGRKVNESELTLADRKTGTIRFYRPKR